MTRSKKRQNQTQYISKTYECIKREGKKLNRLPRGTHILLGVVIVVTFVSMLMCELVLFMKQWTQKRLLLQRILDETLQKAAHHN